MKRVREEVEYIHNLKRLKCEENEPHIYIFYLYDFEQGIPFLDVGSDGGSLTLFGSRYDAHCFHWNPYSIWLAKQFIENWLISDLLVVFLPFFFDHFIEKQAEKRISYIKKFPYFKRSYHFENILTKEEAEIQFLDFCIKRWREMNFFFHVIPRKNKNTYLK